MVKFRLKGKKGGKKGGGAGMPRIFGGAGAMAHFSCSEEEDTFFCNLSKMYSIIMMLFMILVVCYVLFSVYQFFRYGGFAAMQRGKRGGRRR